MTSAVDSTVAPLPRLTRRGLRLGEAGMAYLLNLPALLLICVLTVLPIISAFWISLHHDSLRRPDDFGFVGFQNYVELLTTSDFWNSLYVTLLFTFWTTILVLVIAMVVALVMNEPFR